MARVRMELTRAEEDAVAHIDQMDRDELRRMVHSHARRLMYDDGEYSRHLDDARRRAEAYERQSSVLAPEARAAYEHLRLTRAAIVEGES